MGVNFSDIVGSVKKDIVLQDLKGRKVAVDAFNTMFQFLSIIRDRMTGEPLRDSKGQVTSHLSGLLYRTTSWIESGIRPVFVFDGKPPDFKHLTIQQRKAIRADAKEKWEEAKRKGEPAIKYAQAASELNDEMIEDAKKLLKFMGVPTLQAPSEGEAQCAFMAREGEVWAAGSQDYDSLMFGSPRLVKNLSITGKRKVPRKDTYVDINPEIIELDDVLKNLGINQTQLIIMGLLIGTDYNEGVTGYGPKKSLEIVKKEKTLEGVMKKVTWIEHMPAEDLLEFFLHPPVDKKYKLEWKEPDEKNLLKFMVDEHDFSKERVEKVLERLNAGREAAKQSSLGSFVKT
jgi:flap endonuclease-1